jgi:hypothetical protein
VLSKRSSGVEADLSSAFSARLKSFNSSGCASCKGNHIL